MAQKIACNFLSLAVKKNPSKIIIGLIAKVASKYAKILAEQVTSQPRLRISFTKEITIRRSKNREVHIISQASFHNHTSINFRLPTIIIVAEHIQKIKVTHKELRLMKVKGLNQRETSIIEDR
jgi:hypothetical protein